MATIQEYWAYVAAKRAELEKKFGPGAIVFLTSEDNSDKGTRAGMVSEVPIRKAAEFIVMKTHRLSTDGEKGDHRKDSEKRGAEIERKKHENALALANALQKVAQQVSLAK